MEPTSASILPSRARKLPQGLSHQFDRTGRRSSHVDEAVVADFEALPFPDRWFDLVFSRSVLEHLPRPEVVFKELERVLKPEGRIIAMTPNRNLYLAMLSRMTPEWIHRLVGSVRDVPEQDIFPMFYRANTPGTIRRLCSQSGLVLEGMSLSEGKPAYLTITPWTYALGIGYERLVNSSHRLDRFRSTMLFVGRKA